MISWDEFAVHQESGTVSTVKDNDLEISNAAAMDLIFNNKISCNESAPTAIHFYNHETDDDDDDDPTTSTVDNINVKYYEAADDEEYENEEEKDEKISSDLFPTCMMIDKEVDSRKVEERNDDNSILKDSVIFDGLSAKVDGKRKEVLPEKTTIVEKKLLVEEHRLMGDLKCNSTSTSVGGDSGSSLGSSTEKSNNSINNSLTYTEIPIMINHGYCDINCDVNYGSDFRSTSSLTRGNGSKERITSSCSNSSAAEDPNLMAVGDEAFKPKNEMKSGGGKEIDFKEKSTASLFNTTLLNTHPSFPDAFKEDDDDKFLTSLKMMTAAEDASAISNTISFSSLSSDHPPFPSIPSIGSLSNLSSNLHFLGIAEESFFPTSESYSPIAISSSHRCINSERLFNEEQKICPDNRFPSSLFPDMAIMNTPNNNRDDIHPTSQKVTVKPPSSSTGGVRHFLRSLLYPRAEEKSKKIKSNRDRSDCSRIVCDLSDCSTIVAAAVLDAEFLRNAKNVFVSNCQADNLDARSSNYSFEEKPIAKKNKESINKYVDVRDGNCCIHVNCVDISKSSGSRKSCGKSARGWNYLFPKKFIFGKSAESKVFSGESRGHANLPNRS